MISTEYISNLYKKYKNELCIQKNNMRNIYSNYKNFILLQFDDIEAEITILFLLELKPKNVVEFSPCGGWSTSIILNTLSYNNNNANLKSYDIQDKCQKFIEHLNIKNVDCLFIDSYHSTEFGKKYIEDLLIPLWDNCKNINKKILVSVHDIYHEKIARDEGKEIEDWLTNNNINFYTAARCKNKHYHDINKIRIELQEEPYTIILFDPIHSDRNTCIFFILE